MHWLYLLVALAALVVAFKTTSVALLVVCLLVALGLFLMWVMRLLSQRVDNQSRDASLMVDPAELRRLREQAEARKLAQQAQATPPGDGPR